MELSSFMMLPIEILSIMLDSGCMKQKDSLTPASVKSLWETNATWTKLERFQPMRVLSSHDILRSRFWKLLPKILSMLSSHSLPCPKKSKRTSKIRQPRGPLETKRKVSSLVRAISCRMVLTAHKRAQLQLWEMDRTI